MTAGTLSWIVLVSRPAEILYLACILRFMHAQSWSVGALAVRTSYDIPQGSVRHSGMQGIRWYDSRRAVDEGIRHCDHHVRDPRLGSRGTLTLTPRTLERPPDRCSASPDTSRRRLQVGVRAQGPLCPLRGYDLCRSLCRRRTRGRW